MELTLDTICDIKLYQNKKGYRFSVDALLLYSFINLRRAYRIADMGAGSGIVGILLAKKYHDSEVALIEIQDSLARLAEKNITLSKVEKRVKVIRTDIKKFKFSNPELENETIMSQRNTKSNENVIPRFNRGIQKNMDSRLKTAGMTEVEVFSGETMLLSPNSFDLVVSNPPFRRQKTGLISPTDEKAVARHEIELKLADLIQASCSLLRSKGRLCMIYHPSRLVELIDALREKHMEPKRLRFVHSTLTTEAKMVLVEAIKDGKAEMKIEKPFCIYKEDGTYTDEIKALY